MSWEDTALMEHKDRTARLIAAIESAYVGDATIYQALVPHADLPGVDRDIPLLRLVFSDRVFFDTDRTEIRPDALNVIRLVAEALRKDAPDVALFVAGHADARGTDSYNYRLSFRRANAVAAALFRMGIGQGRLWQIGFGEAVPIAPNDTPENMALNRRVEFLYAARAEVVAVWLSKQSLTVCEGYPENVQATCRARISSLPTAVALPMFNERTASADPMELQREVISDVATTGSIAITPGQESTEVEGEKTVVTITRESPIIINLPSQRVMIGEPRW